MDKGFYEKVTDIISNFDFEKVHEVMEFLHWTWGDEGVPNVSEMMKFCSRILLEAFEGKTQIASGGFTARYDEEDDTLSLRFTIAELEVYNG